MTEVLDLGVDDGPDDAETVVVSWLSPLLPAGQVSNTRAAGAPLPYILVNHLDSTEIVEESTADALVSVHVLTPKSSGEVFLRNQADRVHRRMIRLALWLEDVPLSGGRFATIESVRVAQGMAPVPYGDDQILRKVGRYRLGLDYATVL